MEIKHLYWGPCITRFQLEDSFCKELLQKGKKTRTDHRSELVGFIEKEFKYTEFDKSWFVNNFKQYMLKHMEFLRKWHSKPFQVNLRLNNLWINFMNSGESNPLHVHTGDLTFVIYLQIPEELKEENKQYKGTDDGGPGSIKFINDLKNEKLCISRHSIFPKENECFIFPASLNHMVSSFKTKAERISVSGNFYFIE